MTQEIANAGVLTSSDGSKRRVRVENGQPVFTCGDLVATFGRGARFVLVRRVADSEPAFWVEPCADRPGALRLVEAPNRAVGPDDYGLTDRVASEVAMEWLAPLPLAARAQYVIDDLAAAPRAQDNRPVAERALALARSFPSLRDLACLRDGWEPEGLARFITSPAMTSGSKHAALFVLEIWNGCGGLNYCPVCWDLVTTRERTGDRISVAERHGKPCCAGAGKPAVVLRFQLADAIATWDGAHRAAFRVWAQEPYTL